MQICTWVKLRSGEWGIRGPRDLAAGTYVAVRRRDGQVAYHMVGKVVWRGPDAALATLAKAVPPAVAAADKPREYGGGGRRPRR